jgi:hypothetical protein
LGVATDALLTQLFTVGVDGLDVARTAWKEWHAGATLTDLKGLADHVEKKHEAFTDAIDRLRKAPRGDLRNLRTAGSLCMANSKIRGHSLPLSRSW